MRLAIPAVLLWLFIMPVGESNCWRGITPLRSSCDDVKKILNIETCSTPVTRYATPELQVMIDFATGDCERAPQSWRVPKDTVIFITISPRQPMTPSQFGLDLSKYRKRDDGEIDGLEHYTNEEDGVAVNVYAGTVLNLFLYPRKADEVMRCKPPGKAEVKPQDLH
jgi:hypothetical protein